MSEFEPIICIDGVFDASVSPLDRGLAYGDGLFETCRVSAGRIPLWRYHQERLQASCERLGLPLDLDHLMTQNSQMLSAAERQGHTEGILKLMVTRGTGGRGYQPPADPLAMLCWIFYPGAKPQWTQGAVEGVSVWLCQQRLSDNPVLAGMKHLSRLEYVLARAEWGNQHAEGLLFDRNEHLVEGTISNVFTITNGHLATPPLQRSGVAGVMRRVILDQLAPRLTLPVTVQDVPLAQLQEADEVFVCNSVFGLWPVIELAGMVPGGASERSASGPSPSASAPRRAIGPVTRSLQEAFADWRRAGP